MSIQAANAQFAVKLLQQLQDSSEPSNVFFSPLSVSVAMAMAYAGAEKETKAEMESVLFKGLTDTAVHDSFATIVPLLISDTDKYTLHLANRLYAQKDMAFKEPFLQTCASNYESPLAPVDFKNDAEKVRGEINEWVEQATERRITNLIPLGTLNNLTRLVIVNAIYFKGNWARRFESQLTREETFFILPDKETKKETMNRNGTFLYYEDGCVQVLGLPYKGSPLLPYCGGNSLCMYLFLPKKRCGLKEWSQKVSSQEMQKLIDSCRMEEVSVPKWRIETSFALNDILKKLGMPLAFDEDKANFSRIADCPLYISHVLHKAFIEASEEGTEAAAATAVVIAHPRSATFDFPRRTFVFRADHPFLFLIAKQKHWLFLGTLEQ